jgi:hypothetical protein
MCWSANGSLATWAAGMTLALAANKQYDPVLWTFMVIFTQIQLVEYFLWRNLKIPRLNSLWSKAGLVVILLEPIAAIYMIKNKNLRFKFLVAYGVYVMALLMTQQFNFSTKIGLNGHLQWNWLIPLWKFLPWFVFLLAPMWIGGKNHGTFLLCSITLLMSLYFYFKYKTVGTMWCWIAVFAWVLYFFKSTGLHNLRV